MKIAIIINLFPPKWLAGTEIATYNLAEHLAKRGHEIHVITSHDDGLPNFEKENGFYIHRIAWPKIRIIGVLLFWLQIFLKIRTIKPDIVQAQDLSMGISADLSRKILKIPHIVWGRGSDVYLPGRFTKITSKPILHNADAVLALTEDMRQKMKGIVDREIFVVPNGINLEQFTDRSPIIVREKGQKNILFVGRLHPVKGVQYLIRAMKRVLEEIPDGMLILVGDGEERGNLEALSVQLGVQKSVQFVGVVPHEKVHSYMQQADVFVLPSLSEGFPGVILEAMACGLPVVVTRVGGIPDIIENGVNGYIAETKSPDEIAEKILILLQNDQLKEKISIKNKEKVKEYKWDNIVFELENIYKKITN
jgi:glycosyltransferase involved in cell wall biosynthesis